MSADLTLTLTAPVHSQPLFIELVQDGTANWTVTWPSSVKVDSGGGMPGQQGLLAGEKDLYTLVYNKDSAEYRFLQQIGNFS